ncbi:MAG: triose-phosphate isomerase [Sandaracinaceae bacterium]
MSRRPLVAGNWKLHLGVDASVALARDVAEGTAATSGVDVIVAPVFTSLRSVHEALADSRVGLAGQDLHWEDQGAFTGEVSGPLLRDVGCTAVLIGHSERRQLFGETDEGVRRKVRAALGHDLQPIVCVGETLEERDAGATEATCLRQLDAAIGELTAEELGRIVIAYEPVWAIGTGRTAAPDDAQRVHARLRRQVEERFGPGAAAGLRILYGGSVKPANASALMAEADIDGALVGGASLDSASFLAIVQAAPTG